MVGGVSPCFNGKRFYDKRCSCLQSHLNCKTCNTQRDVGFSLCQSAWRVPPCGCGCRLGFGGFGGFSPRVPVFRSPGLGLAGRSRKSTHMLNCCSLAWSGNSSGVDCSSSSDDELNKTSCGCSLVNPWCNPAT